MADILTGPIGAETFYRLVFEQGKLKIKVAYDGKQLDGAVELALDTDAVLDALAQAIPGQIDDAVIALIRQALKAV